MDRAYEISRYWKRQQRHPDLAQRNRHPHRASVYWREGTQHRQRPQILWPRCVSQHHSRTRPHWTGHPTLFGHQRDPPYLQLSVFGQKHDLPRIPQL